MKIKKTVVSVFFFLTIPVFYAQQFFSSKQVPVLILIKTDCFPIARLESFFTTDTCFGGLGDVWGMPDVRAFCDYKFKFWTWDIYKSNLEPGVMAGFMFCSFGFVPVWHIKDNSW